MSTVFREIVGFCPAVEVSGVAALKLSRPVLLRVNDPPSATAPPPFRPEPAVTVNEGFWSIPLVTPPFAMLKLPAPVMGPPVNPAPLPTLVTDPPPVPGKVCPVANVIKPLLLMKRPVSAGAAPLDPNRRFKLLEGIGV